MRKLWFALKDTKDYLAYRLRYGREEFRYEHIYLGASWFGFVVNTVLEAYRVFVCSYFGHKLREENADAENGCSDIYCSRCGYSDTIWF